VVVVVVVMVEEKKEVRAGADGCSCQRHSVLDRDGFEPCRDSLLLASMGWFSVWFTWL